MEKILNFVSVANSTGPWQRARKNHNKIFENRKFEIEKSRAIRQIELGYVYRQNNKSDHVYMKFCTKRETLFLE